MGSLTSTRAEADRPWDDDVAQAVLLAEALVEEGSAGPRGPRHRQGTGGAAAPVRIPSPHMVENVPWNAICRKLGYTLLGGIDFSARQWGFLRCNDWRFDLFGNSGG